MYMHGNKVTRRMDAVDEEWSRWNWRTEGDMMVNGAYFVPSGDGLGAQFALASSVEPRAAGFIDQITRNAGTLPPTMYLPSSNLFIFFFILYHFLLFSNILLKTYQITQNLYIYYPFIYFSSKISFIGKNTAYPFFF